MHIHPPFLKIDHQRPPFFDGTHEDSAQLSFRCQGGEHQVDLTLLDFLSTAQTWFEALSKVDRSQIIRHFSCTRTLFDGHELLRSHSNEPAYFGIATCPICQCSHLLYLSYYEKQPGRYVARLQGAASVER